MRPRVSGWWTCLAACAAACIAISAAHASRREVVQLRYQAPAECPARGALVDAIRQRTTAAEITEAAASGRRFTVAITADAGAFRGALEVDDDAARELAAPRCDDLVAALALIIALAIDPPGAVAEAPPPPPPPRLSIMALAGGGAVAGVSPGAAMSTAIEARVGLSGRGHAGVAAILGADDTRMADGDASFLWAAARGSVCWQWLNRAVGGDACGHVEIGGLRVRATEVARAQEARRLWLAPGLHAALRWPQNHRFFAELQLGASVPIVRDRFYFDGGDTIHRTWFITPWAVFGAGVRFGRSR